LFTRVDGARAEPLGCYQRKSP